MVQDMGMVGNKSGTRRPWLVQYVGVASSHSPLALQTAKYLRRLNISISPARAQGVWLFEVYIRVSTTLVTPPIGQQRSWPARSRTRLTAL